MKFVTQDYYQILNVSPEANGEEVKRAYRTVRQSFRPDSMAVHSLYSPEETETISAKIDEAFQILSQPELAGNYRRYHSHGRGGMTIPRTPEVFFDEVHELDARSPIEALAVAVGSSEAPAAGFDEDTLDRAEHDDEEELQSVAKAPVQPLTSSPPQPELLLASLEEFREPGLPVRGQSRNHPRATAAPRSERPSRPTLGPVSTRRGVHRGSQPEPRASSATRDSALTSPSLRSLSEQDIAGGGPQASAARNLNPVCVVPPRKLEALPSEELEAIEVDCQGINGAYLRKVRETMGLDLFYIAAQTKIGRAMLSYIEDDLVEELPARVYLKGYLGHIARLLKLPASQTVDRYLANLEAR